MINWRKENLIKPYLFLIESNYYYAFKGNPNIEKETVRNPEKRDLFGDIYFIIRALIKLIRQITKTPFRKQRIKYLRKVKRKLYR